ncbi:MAG: hypothetical protein K2H59_08970, partial [Muribaculaceae bacterium]|nr:hypothetical protein [Muribaculaceae bacterium]
SIRVDIPEFDFFVIKFTWSASDVDIKCGFTGNATSVTYRDINYPTGLSSSFNDKYVGWSQNNPPVVNGTTYLTWGGDATGGQGETVFFNAKAINQFPYPGGKDSAGKRCTASTPNMLPRVMKFLCAAGWYTSGASGNVTCTIYCYLGGSMAQSGTNFNNSGGSQVYTNTKTYNIASGKTKPAGSYLRFCFIEYDRKKHTASVTWDGATVI